MTQIAKALSFAILLIASSVLASSITNDQDGIPHVMNTTAAEGVQRLELVEQWRAGGEDDDVFFGVIPDVTTGPDGNVYLLDMQLAQVHVYTPDGTYLGPLGGEGDGPGEFRQPTNIVVLPGGKLGISAGFPGKIVVLDMAGVPDVSIVPGDPSSGGFSVVLDVQTVGDHMVLCGAMMVMDEDGMQETRYLASVDAKGQEITRYWDKTGMRDFSNPSFNEREEFFAQGRYDIDAEGNLYLSRDRDRYAVSVFDAQGVLQRVVERPDYEPRQRTESEKSDVTSGMRIVVNDRTLELENVVEDTEPAIARLFVDDDGLLWVSDSHGERNEGVFRRYDVFDAEGSWLRSVDIVITGDPEQDGLMPLGDGRFLLIKGLIAAVASIQGDHAGTDADKDDEDDSPLEVICFRMP